MTPENIQQVLHQARNDAHATAADALGEWQRVRDHTTDTRAERYDPDHDTALQHALRGERHRRDVAEYAREAAGPGNLTDFLITAE
ncbi:hypothetical protein ACFWOG_12335 [Kitasatospora sp. NPDC058406]|uniref:hypothetical protein n=1 Tax=Kitasatospora sp. NPDC058406 TaxID=3346483 RepID=UPI0036593E9E